MGVCFCFTVYSCKGWRCRIKDIVGCSDVASEQLQDPAVIVWSDEQEPQRITAIAVTRWVMLIIRDSSYMHK